LPPPQNLWVGKTPIDRLFLGFSAVISVRQGAIS
jgi:hypothetical protein